MKIYKGSAAAARHYVEAGRGRADDYYLAEGTGVADRYVASPETGVRRVAPLTGDAYEAWVAGLDPDTGVAKGRLRHDANAVRFVEVGINGPKSWSLAAELYPDVSAAYDAAQDSAARQIIGWLAEHATTRVGGRGAQVQLPVTEIEAAVVRHHTSRAGDPHRHLHLQINARVFTEGVWRGLHTVGVRDSIEAINGIGHAAVMTDPGFRAALAAHGYTLEPDTGEIVQLAKFVGPFSARAAQIGRNIDRYEADWRVANPSREPGPALRRAWDARAWADARPDKVVPRDGAELTRRWVAELRELGYRDPTTPVPVAAVSVGSIDRERTVGEVLTRLAARRSAWNAADVRGQVEQLLARHGIVTDPTVRAELAEDLTARTLARCVPLLKRDGLPEHLRALTAQPVLDVEADLVARLAARAATPAARNETLTASAAAELDVAQGAVLAALAGQHQLLLIEGAAGAGKTTTLTAARAALAEAGHRLVVVTPTLKAARVATGQLGSPASSAARLAYQHGYRRDGAGAWTRLAVGENDPVTGRVFTGPDQRAQLGRGDLMLVDEAGMLDQDTARAVLVIADECGARLALMGDRHQLPAVGRGGVLDLAARWAPPEARLTLDTVHRFTRTTTSPDGAPVVVPDEEYARLSLTMRTGTDASGAFDALHARGQIHIHATESDRTSALAETGAEALTSGQHATVIADTREQVAALNAAIRDRLVAAGQVEDTTTATTNAGQRIGAGDHIATRRNDPTLGVANRDTWHVTHVHPDGSLRVTQRPQAGVTPRKLVGDETHNLPADYVRMHVELAYASTVYGVQGDTTQTAHLTLGEHTSAASAYVAMTRGRERNVAHLVADSTEDAREQWIAVFGRDRADLGPAHAAERAAAEASRYAHLRPLHVLLAELHRAWTYEADCQARADAATRHRGLLAEIVALTDQRDATVPALKRDCDDTREAARRAVARASEAEAAVSAHAAQIQDGLQRQWDEQYAAARHAAQIVRAGAGRFGHRLVAVRDSTEQLARWSAAWQPYLPSMPTHSDRIADFAGWHPANHHTRVPFGHYARTVAEHAHPELALARDDAADATARSDCASRAYHEADGRIRAALSGYGRLGRVQDPAGALAEAEIAVVRAVDRLAEARAAFTVALADPAVRILPPEQIAHQRDTWAIERDTAHDLAHRPPARRPPAPRPGELPRVPSATHEPWTPAPQHTRGISR